MNVNIPNLDLSEIRGIRIARQGFRFYKNEVIKRTDPRGKDYYWIGGAYEGFHEGELTDCHAVEERYVSVAPINIDSTHNQFYTTLPKRLP